MNIAYFNGEFIDKEKINISPDDRGFLFADGIYEVMKWYGGFYYDIESHLTRMKRSLHEIRLNWDDADSFPSIANELIHLNHISDYQAITYLQVTRGAAPRTHSFPNPSVKPTVYLTTKKIFSQGNNQIKGTKVILKEDFRWGRCDIKSVALLANTLAFQEANEKGFNECVFIRNGLITEGSRSNIFFVKDNILYTHPESNYILSGVTRKNVVRIAGQEGIEVKEEAIKENELMKINEAFVVNTSSEISPVLDINGQIVGKGEPGPITKLIHNKFWLEIERIKG
jgi:D-alanine transaminase